VAAAVVRHVRRRKAMAITVSAVGLGVLVLGTGLWLFVPGAFGAAGRALGLSRPATGTLVIETAPAGWEVLEGSKSLGKTPLRASLPPGPHALVLVNGSATRPLDVVLRAGVEVVHHVVLEDAGSTGVLHVTTTPPGALVDVDGVGRGASPVDIGGMAPGEHTVSITADGRTVNERVTVTPGRTTSVFVPMVRAEGPAGGVGFVAVSAPIELQVFEGESLVGSSRNERIMLMAGRRTLRFANPGLGFERTMAVTVEPGAVVKMTVAVPNGTLSVNAVPWAEVLLDGRVIGETPIANLSVPLGSHEILLRNPKFVERRQTVVVSLLAPARVGIDLRQ
jgi:hypothetical protein